MGKKSNSPEAKWTVKEADGVKVREVSIDAIKSGRPIEIVQLSDIHFNYINDRDREENHELVISSYNDPVLWLKDGASSVNLQRCFEYAGAADQVVITGDLMSYLSYGNLELIKKYVFDPHPDIIAGLGNHDPLRSWRASVDERDTLDERLKIIEDNWIHDIYYSSKVIDGRVMIIQMDNGLKSEYAVPEAFWECQLEPLKRDLSLARENGYTVLLFYHIPISTGNPINTETYAIGSDTKPVNLYNGNLIGSHSKGVSKDIYELIINSGDVIKATFCGHMHADYYTEICAKDKDGNPCIIPQYTLTAMPYNNGHVVKITLK